MARAHRDANGANGEVGEGLETTNSSTSSTAAGGVSLKMATTSVLLGSIARLGRRRRARAVAWTRRLELTQPVATQVRWRAPACASAGERDGEGRGGGAIQGGNGRRRLEGVPWREVEARAACCVAGVERMLATQWRARLAGEEDEVAPLGWARWAFALGER